MHKFWKKVKSKLLVLGFLGFKILISRIVVSLDWDNEESQFQHRQQSSGDL